MPPAEPFGRARNDDALVESEADLADRASSVYDPTLVLYLANDRSAVLSLDPGYDPLQAARAPQTLADLP